MIKNFADFSFVLSQKRQFFGENILKIYNIGPWPQVLQQMSGFSNTFQKS
jgi:hypothetical protein